MAANEPELLAYHYGEAGLPAPPATIAMRAGERAVNRAAYHEAIAHFSAGLNEAEKLPDAAERMRRQLDFLLKLGPALDGRLAARKARSRGTLFRRLRR